MKKYSALVALMLLLVGMYATAGPLDPAPKSTVTLSQTLYHNSVFLPVHQAFQVQLIANRPEALVLRFIAADGYYLYRHRFAARAEPASVALGPLQIAPGRIKDDPYFGRVEVHHGIVDLGIPLNNPTQQAFTLVVRYQGCAEQGLCYPPEEMRFTIDPTTAVAATSAPSQQHSSIAWSEVLLFFLYGLGLTFTPCVLPMLPIVCSVVLGSAHNTRRRFSLGLAYILPMAVCFALLGALIGLFGAELNLQARLQSPWVLVPFALFFVGFALALFGLYELRLPASMRNFLDQKAGQVQGGSLWGAAVLGVLSSLLVSPCVSAPLAAALVYISSTGDTLGGGLKLFSLGLGMGAPLLVFACGGAALLPKSGPWMVAVRNTFGVLLLAVALWLLARVLPQSLNLLLWGLLAGGVALQLGALELSQKSAIERLGQLLGVLLLTYAVMSWVAAFKDAENPLRPVYSSIQSDTATQPTKGRWNSVSTAADLRAQLAAAQAARQPVLLDFYAEWCISCKIIEHQVLPRPEIQSQLAAYRLIRFDITQNTQEQRALLNQYQLFGPPALLLMSANGQEWRDLRTMGETNAVDLGQKLGIAQQRIQAESR